MGTHFIFEYDFDCLTESLNMSDYPALRKQIENIGDTNIANDPRFVNTNRARQCWVNYADYYRCLAVRQQNGKDTAPREYFRNQFLQMCPLKWMEEFDDQRANRCFPSKIYSMEPANSRPLDSHLDELAGRNSLVSCFLS